MKGKYKAKIFLMACAACLFAGCGSTSEIDTASSTEELTAEEFFKTNCEAEADKGITKLIVNNVYLTNREDGKIGRQGWSSTSYYDDSRFAVSSLLDDYFNENPSLAECIEENRTYTVYINLSRKGNFFWGYEYHSKIEKIEIFRTIEEITAEKEAKVNKVRSDWEKAIAEFEKRVKENHSTVDSKGKSLAKGYVYHGYDEADNNRSLFIGGAMEKGHAYLILSCIPSESGNYVKCGNKTVWVDYVNTKVKQDVVLRKNSYAAILVTKNDTTSVVLGLVADGYEYKYAYDVYKELGYDTSTEAVHALYEAAYAKKIEFKSTNIWNVAN